MSRELLNNPLLTLTARVCSIFGAALASGAVWIFLQAWGDIHTQAVANAKQDQALIRLAERQDAMGRRVDGLEVTVYGYRRSDAGPLR